MVSAFTLIKVESNRNASVYEKLCKISIVKEVALVYGEYDIVIKTETRSIDELNNFVYENLRKIPGITMTTTMITARLERKTA